VDGDLEILPGVELLSTPGHTPGLQSVAARHGQGSRGARLGQRPPAQQFRDGRAEHLITDLPAMLTSFTKLRDRVGDDLARLFPGHDVKLLTEYPQIAPDVTGWRERSRPQGAGPVARPSGKGRHGPGPEPSAGSGWIRAIRKDSGGFRRKIACRSPPRTSAERTGRRLSFGRVDLQGRRSG
jgi:glyoxylase-like metal-dependent hydrolase (beta-lactamase superfamily II)